MNRNDWLLLLLYLLTATFIVPHSCVPRRSRCSTFTFPNGRVLLRHRGRVAKFFCNKGYKLIGDRIATCHNGQWDTTPNCVKDIECPTPMPKVQNGRMEIAHFVYFEIICNPGFKVPSGVHWIYPCELFSDPNMVAPSCELTNEQFCDFEKDMCNWNNTMPSFPWIRHQNATPSHFLRTGPGEDHTYGDGHPASEFESGHYLYIETSGISYKEERYAKLVRRFWKMETTEVCFIFWYHMYGFSIGTLEVYVDYTKVFTKTGNLGDKWRKGIIQNLPQGRDFYVSIVATTGDGFAGDIAIDDIGLVNSTDCTKVLLIETSCKNRCFEVEVNSTLCKCSSECLIEGTCCGDFMTTCGADALTSTLHSETISEESSSTEYSATISNVPTDETSIIDGNVSSTVMDSTSYDSEYTRVTFEDDMTSNSVIKITESRHSKYERSSSTYPSHTDTTVPPQTPKSEDWASEVQLITGYSSSPTSTTVESTGTKRVNPIPTSRSIAWSSSIPFKPAVTMNTMVEESSSLGTPESAVARTKQAASASSMLLITDNISLSYTSALTTSTTTLVPTVKNIPNIATPPSVTKVQQPTMKSTAKLTTKFEKPRPTAATFKTPATTSKAPAATSKAQVTTSKTPATTPKAPTITSKAPPITSKAPAITSKAPAITSKAPATSSKAPPTTSKAPPTTSKAPTTTSKAPATTPKKLELTTTAATAAKTFTSFLTPSTYTDFQSSAEEESDNQPIDSDFSTTQLDGESPYVTRSSRPTVKGLRVPYKRTYVPKGRYTFSAVKSENKTTTYVTVVVGLLIFLSAAIFAGYVFFRRQQSHRFRGSAEESDVLYMTSDDILDFSVARRPPSSPAASSSSQQMLCQTEY